MIEYDAEAMVKACVREAPREACGLVFPSGLTLELDNVRSLPGQYVMHEGQFRQAVLDHGMFGAIWHTHPNGDFAQSPFDREYHLRFYPHLPMIIATHEVTVVYGPVD